MKNQRLTDSFRIAAKGFVDAFRKEYHIQIAFFIAVLAVLYSCFLGLTLAEWIIIAVFSSMVVSLEMMNSALEELADAIHPEWDARVGLAKDLAAGAVLASIVAAAAAGLPVFVNAFSRHFSVPWVYSLCVNVVLALIGIGLLLLWDLFRR